MNSRKDSHFTLIELLTVIAIIMILAALLLPAITRVRFRAKVAQTRSDIKALQIAVEQFEAVYGYPPLYNLGIGADASTTSTNSLVKGVLTGTNTSTNPRGIIFLELQPGDTFVDPWGNAYRMVLDLNYDGKIDQTKISGPPISADVPGSVAIWSDGDTVQWITSWDDD
jgi:type II secretory pathway pseudopilin PulG